MNVGQLKKPPMVWCVFCMHLLTNINSQISNPVWPLTPETLRPSFAETKDIVERLVDDFTTKRSRDLAHISGLSQILDTLRSILST